MKMKWSLLIVALLALSACAPQPSVPTESAARQQDDGVPESVRAIRGLLMAFHAEDLPDAETLHAHDDAEASLIYLSQHAELLLVRARALSSLRFFPTQVSARHLLEVLRAPSTHPKLIAAALHGCERRHDEELMSIARDLRAHPDPRIRRAAGGVLGANVVEPSSPVR